MALINCRECEKEISNSVKICPHCGAKTPDINKYEQEKRAKNVVAIFFATIFLLPVLIIVLAMLSPSNDYSTEKTSSKQDPIAQQAYSTPSSDFIKSNPELGELTFPYVESTSNWAQGTREWVTTNKGTYLFYLKGDEVVTVYLSDENADGGKREIWRKSQNNNSSTATPSTDQKIKSDNQVAVKWEIYQPTLKQDIEKMVEENNCDVLEKYFDNAFDIQQSSHAGNPHAALVVYIAGKRSDAGCQS